LQGWEELKQKYPNHRLCFSPEFLRATQWMSDIQTMKDVILSGDTDYWRDQYSYNWSEMTIKIVSPEEAIAIKYFRNAYLATKVSFFNEIHDFCSVYDLDFDQVRGGIASDERIGHSHTFVFPDQNIRGFGGMCFPKDTSALRKMAANKNINLNILDAAVKYNKEITNNT
jgi:UDPglucose 6-dehydrogenase